MTDQPGRTSGETMGADQRPTEPGDQDATQQEQARREGAPATHDPSQPDSDAFGQSPDAAYGQREDQAEDTETVVTGG